MTSSPKLTAFLLLALCACTDGSGTPAIVTRTFTPHHPLELRKVSSRDRLGVDDGASPHAGGGAMGGGMEAQGDPREALSYTVPPGWSELAPAPLRIVNLRVAGNPKGECYLTFLTGAGGGAKGNIDRWREQMGLGPIAEAELQALPTLAMFGHAAPFVVLEGEFRAFDGTKNPGFALAGVVLPRDGQAMTVKMTGPKELVQAELPNFKTFVASLGPAKPRAGASSRPASSASVAPPAPEAKSGSGRLSYTAPAHWKQAGPRPMREVTFVPDGAPKTECWISFAMGSLESNVGRWRGFFGQGPLSAGEIAALPTWTVLGKASRVVELRGKYSPSMGGTPLEDAMMIGVVSEQSPESVFVRITGPRAEVERERANFESFCKSLR